MTYKPAGNPCDLWGEHIRLNPGTFSTTVGSDDWRHHASIGSIPSRNNHQTDGTAYSTQPAEDSWYTRFNGSLSPAKVTAGSSGAIRQGQLS